MKRRLITLLIAVCLVAILVPLTVSAATPQNGWDRDGEYWTYYQNGEMVTDRVLRIGDNYYGFDWDGHMYDDEEFILDAFYRAKPGGALYVNAWTEREGNWYYYGAEGRAACDFLRIGNDWYFFFEGGRMASDQIVWSIRYQGYYVISPDGKNSTLMTTPGWHTVYGGKYYMYDNGVEVCPAIDELMTIGDITYGFHHTGKLAIGEMLYLYDYEYEDWYTFIADDNGEIVTHGWLLMDGELHYVQNGILFRDGLVRIDGKLYYFDHQGLLMPDTLWWTADPETGDSIQIVILSDGSVLENGWGKAEGSWFYAEDGQYLCDGIYEIDGKLYCFDYDGRMVEHSSLFDSWICITADGSLLRNAWRKINIGLPGWAYYGDDGYRLFDTFIQIGGKCYYFDYNGLMAVNTFAYTDQGIYVFDSNGYGTPARGWFKVGDHWFYEKDGDTLCGIHQIGSVTYCFEENFGYLLSNDIVFDDAGICYAADAEGRLITTIGWKKLNGYWVYVEDSQGHLACGVRQLGGKTYFFDDYGKMIANDIAYDYDANRWYILGSNGAGTVLTGTGFRSIGSFRVYIENGVPVREAWRKLGGAWYYFWYDGEPHSNGPCEVNGTLYLFDDSGKLHSGWLTTEYGGTYYANSDGVVYTGLQTIDGKQYYFYDDGYLHTGDLLELDGVYYLLWSDGSIRATLTEGWNQVGSEYYYFEYGDLLRDTWATIGGEDYYFAENGVMCANTIIEQYNGYYLLDANGHPVTGWFKLNGKWYYALESDNSLWWEGAYEIGGVLYLFKDGTLYTGTYYDAYHYYTSNAAGVVIDSGEYSDGWIYVDGKMVYRPYGRIYTGWAGDYYVENGNPVVDWFVEYRGNYYYLGRDGRYVKSGWYQDSYDQYIYAKAGGVLAYNEWLQVGGKWYYFSDMNMVQDTTYLIGGVYHKFSASGEWLGQVPAPTTPTTDGWHFIDGSWYYYHCGQPVSGMQYINGKWYYFDERDNRMIDSGFYRTEYWTMYYFGADGARVDYVGWMKFDNDWIYFDADHAVHEGLLQLGNKLYYFDSSYSESHLPVMVTNTAVLIRDRLYTFDANGVCTGPVNRNGWYQFGSDWFYLSGGRPVTQEVLLIDGSYYAFDTDGRMIKNDLYDSFYGDGYMYFGADGRAVLTAGWVQTSYDGRWIYIRAGGQLCAYGIYKIGNTNYSFGDFFWLP